LEGYWSPKRYSVERYNDFQRRLKAMATGANTTGNSTGTRRSSKGNKATDDEMLTEVKK